VRRTIEPDGKGSVAILGRTLAPSQSIDLIAIGKAALPMIAGALDSLGDAVKRGFVITKDGHSDRALPTFVESREAAHPVPDERSLAATQSLLEWCASVPPDRLVVCLISGGGSSLLEVPITGISLADLQITTQSLLRAGADIHQVNAVRSRLSQVKGGGLRAQIPARKVITLALSDVLGNDPAVIASGPTVPLNSNRDDARKVIEALDIEGQIPENVIQVLANEQQQPAATFSDDEVAIIADNGLAVEAASTYLAQSGYTVEQDEHPRAGEARAAAIEWVSRLAEVPAEVSALVAGGELTVTVKADGLGGRNTEFALAAAIELEHRKLDGWTVASLATDGQDAGTGVAGAVVDCQTDRSLRNIGVEPRAALARNDSCPGLAAICATHITGPTGTNVNDLYFAVRTDTP
jgi:hydroxypyruvate reductase